MKLFGSVLLSLYLAVGYGVCSKEWTPDCYVTNTVLDSNLKNSEALFLFKFIKSNGKAVAGKIKMSFNNESRRIVCDKEGSFTLKVKPGKYKFKFFLDEKHLEIESDSIEVKPQYKTTLQVTFATNKERTLAEKPVIYLYSPETKRVNVKVNINGRLGFTYPVYNEGWDIIVDKDGNIFSGNKKFHYLFWDGAVQVNEKPRNMAEGFIVDKINMTKFFEEKLSQMGLNSKEIEDYITYWCPRMNANEKNYIHFLFKAEFEKYASLRIDPEPDNLFRVFMLWSAADDNMQVKDQKIESFSRKGFTVVEWGGGEMPSLKN